MLQPSLLLHVLALTGTSPAPPEAPAPSVPSLQPGSLAALTASDTAPSTVAEPDPLPLQERDCAWTWPEGRLSGWYAGLGAGLAYTRAIDNIAEDRLGQIGFNNADTDFDASAWSSKLFMGYRFERPFSIEAGWVDLGEVDGDFRIPPPPPGVGGTFRRDADGFFASAAWHFEERELWSFSAELGGFLWETETTISSAAVPANQRHSSDSGFNPFFGLTAMRTLSERVGARIEYDRFYLDSDPTDLLSLGLFIKF